MRTCCVIAASWTRERRASQRPYSIPKKRLNRIKLTEVFIRTPNTNVHFKVSVLYQVLCTLITAQPKDKVHLPHTYPSIIRSTVLHDAYHIPSHTFPSSINLVHFCQHHHGTSRTWDTFYFPRLCTKQVGITSSLAWPAPAFQPRPRSKT